MFASRPNAESASRTPPASSTFAGAAAAARFRVSDGCLSHSARHAGRCDGWRGFFWAVRYDGTAGHPDYHRVEMPNLQRPTALNWTVTIGYAKVLSRVVKRIPRLRQSPYQFRFFV